MKTKETFLALIAELEGDYRPSAEDQRYPGYGHGVHGFVREGTLGFRGQS